MPPIAKITREMIIDAGFELVREYGMEHVNARAISKKLNCSTQPVMYHFKTIEQIKKEIYQKADKYHSSYITDIQGNNPMLSIGLSYIRFAKTEKHLFRLLFQSNEFDGKSIYELIAAEELEPIIKVLSETANVNITRAKTIFSSLFIFVHGYASMFANNSLEYDEELISKDLKRIFTGMMYVAKDEL
ncbi:MAG: TetR/AcrR family transcriptional regulator [Lachnospiraceae bacterium]|nr:TetR/AcrR family transcriptional regulator [Lachnospiraceae bacterium]